MSEKNRILKIGLYALAAVVALLLMPNKFPPSGNWWLIGVPGIFIILGLVLIARRLK